MRNRVSRAKPKLPPVLPERRRVCRKGEPETMVVGVVVNRDGKVIVTDFATGALLLAGLRSELEIHRV